jgi:CheY-like chemotaxis protein
MAERCLIGEWKDWIAKSASVMSLCLHRPSQLMYLIGTFYLLMSKHLVVLSMRADAVPDAVPPETFLFVEDEALVRMDMAECLRDRGYRVHEAATANQALEALQAKNDVVLVFTDINLPGGMNGLELAEWTWSHRPGLKVLVTTGDVSRMVDSPSAGEAFLEKPYTGRELVDRVRQALTKRPEG